MRPGALPWACHLSGEGRKLSGQGHRLVRCPLLYHPHPKTRLKQGSIKAYLDLILGWVWYRRGYLTIPCQRRSSGSDPPGQSCPFEGLPKKNGHTGFGLPKMGPN